MVVIFIFFVLSVMLITVLYHTDMFGKKNELDYFLALQKLLGMLPFVQLSTCIIQLGGLCLGSLLVISFYDNIAYAMENDSKDAKIESDSAVVNLELDNVRKGHTSTSKNALDDEAKKSGEFQSGSKRKKDIVSHLVNDESEGDQTPTSTLREACFLDLIDMNYSYRSQEEFLNRNGFTCIKIVEGEKYCIDIKRTWPDAPIRWKPHVYSAPAMSDPAYTKIPGQTYLSFRITKIEK